MDKITKILLLILLTTLFFGCKDTVQVEGYILLVEENRVLVIHNVEYSSIESKSVDELMSENRDLVYYTYDDTKGFQKGDKVKIWTSGNAQTSYPSKAGATKIKIIE